MAYKSYKGWYSIQNHDKFIPPEDGYMKSFNEARMQIEYKSSLELKAFKYCDLSPSVKKFSVEPFPIQYLKPVDEMVHRYYPDLFIEFVSGKKVIVEVKSSGETKEPRKPKKLTSKSIIHYKRALVTWSINQAKWKAAQEFCEENGFVFMFLTEKQLNKI